MPETKTLAAPVAINPKLLALTPRQVSLAKNETKRAPTPAAAAASSPMETRTLLLLSIARYLQSSGFSKTLKKFRSEAQLEEVSFNGSTLDLEEICLNYLKTAGHAAMKSGLEKGGTHMIGEGDSGSFPEALDKKKKKRSGESNVDAANHHSQEIKNGAVNENVKGKEKKKGKKNSDFLGKDRKIGSLKELEESVTDVTCGSQSDEITMKGKDKRSKKSELVSESLIPQDVASFEENDIVSSKDVKKSKNKKEKSKHKSDRDEQHTAKDKQDDVKTKAENADEVLSKDDDTKTSDEGMKVKKGSKKRKRLDSKENECTPVDQDALDEPKRRKSGDIKDDKVDRKLNASGMSEGANEMGSNGQNGQCNLTENTPIKHFGDTDNVKRNDGQESAKRESTKKQRDGSAEPTAAKAFQRIKVDEVVYADNRLKDNSYWAKDGADTGYGAKAQEVLGQVRGRDFRHEKTKKKRGTYRGGQIDLQSYSVKFNYSDDE
ncbi:hypothetical protein BT93_J0048 [Corymbia citriodora subsp. variegata]|nr:hypothetical protein BT93_J0048 [Corymbia citriodora subsp. variegata]